VLTNNDGSYYERLEYLPYGEVWVEDAAINSNYRTPYKFTGKELDKETGLYYFGARYYDARISRWISTDPALAEGKYFPKPNDYDTEHDFYWYLQQDGSKKLPGIGGVFNAVNMDVYHYAGNNPVKLVDPDGKKIALIIFGASYTGGPGGQGSLGYVVQYGNNIDFKVYEIASINMSAGLEIGASTTISFFPSGTVDTWKNENWTLSTINIGWLVIGGGLNIEDGKIKGLAITGGVGKSSGISLSVPNTSKNIHLKEIDKNSKTYETIANIFRAYFPKGEVNVPKPENNKK